jgi:EAL domain-containing protein (putative c-di-GMP-specific phosphodiesterase class I)
MPSHIGGGHVTDPIGGPTDLESDIRAAVANNDLVLVYQPEIDLLTRRVVAVEALLRWEHPRLGQLAPESFIAVAERTGLISAIGELVLDVSVGALAEWMADLPEIDLILRINVSPVQLNGPDVVTMFEQTLSKYGVPGTRLCIELTENQPLRDATRVADTLRRLKELGVSSAIDDLATGFSTLSRLRWLPVDVVKLDRSLVADIDADPRAQAIVTAVIGLAINFGMGVVAEGVETEDEVDTLLRLGCTRGQGHLLGMPVPAEAVVEMLRTLGNKDPQNN